MFDLYSLSTLLAMPARSIETIASLKRKKNQLRQIEDRRIEKTKSYAITYDSRGAIAKEGLFDLAACDSLDDAARKREYKTNKRKKEARIRVEIRLEKKQLLWATNVKKYDEEKAHRRLRKKRETQKKLNQLPTSKLDKLRLKDKHNNSKIKMKVDLRVNKQIEWAHTFVTQSLSEFNI